MRTVACLLLLTFACFGVLGKLKPIGKIIKDPKIIGGSAAQAGEFPWYCAIYKTSPSGTFFGAGNLVREDFVMTAAQLVYDASSVEIRLGSVLLEGDDPNRVTVTATKWILYPSWNVSILWQDIALVKLDTPVTLTTYIQPIPAAPFGCCYIYPGNTVTAIGWGQTGDSGDLSNQLQKTEVTFIDQFDCMDYYGTDAILPSMICTVGASSNQGFCYGDVGGALVTPVNYWVGDWMVATAIASFISANGCESTDPNGYTRVDTFYDWIYETMDANM